MTVLSDADGAALVRAARDIVMGHLWGTDGAGRDIPEGSAGIFVTIKKERRLRGCIGHLNPDRPIRDNLRDAAISAATADPRFEGVDADELGKITFEVTVLGSPERISVADPEQYLSEIKVGRDGLIVSRRGASGLLLPQVPGEYGWDVREFLEHTCQKAGLPAGAWRDSDTIVERFAGTAWGEQTPGGSIVRIEL